MQVNTHFENMEQMLADATDLGVELYTEIAPDGVFMRTVAENKLVVRFSQDELTFYDKDEVDIYHINELNEHMKHDSAVINALLDAAWGKEGFGAQVELAFGDAMNVMASIEFMNDSNGDLDND